MIPGNGSVFVLNNGSKQEKNFSLWLQATVFKKLFTTLTKGETISSVPCSRMVSQCFFVSFRFLGLFPGFLSS